MHVRARLQRLLNIKDAEVHAVKGAFTSFFCVLAAYFLILPVRDETVIVLGTDVLPRLFWASLPVTLVAAPAASAFLGRRGVSRHRAVHQLYRILAISFVGFALLHWAVITPAAPPHAAATGASGNAAAAAAATRRQQAHGQEQLHRIWLSGDGSNAESDSAAQRRLAFQRREWNPAAGGNSSIGGGNSSVREGSSGLGGGRVLRQVVELSTAWHSAADSASRGEARSTLSRRNVWRRGRRVPDAQQAVRVAFYLWMSAANLVGVSTMWARAADAFAPDAAARLFGLLGAGATAGQLAGSAVAGLAAAAARDAPMLAAALPTVLMLGAALLLECAGASAAALAPAASAARAADRRLGGNQEVALQPVGMPSGPAACVAGFRLIAASPYLRRVALFLGLNYVVSSAFYFEKAAVVASGVGSGASRTALFAAINGASALLIGAVQLLLTGRLLRRLSPSAALAALPLTAGCLMALVSANPTPATIAAAEVLRKVVAYGVARPAREVLFTVVSRDEKYRAKVVLDTLVQRTGDAAAAAAFSALAGPGGPVGAAGFAAAVAPLCLGWAALGASLGRRQQALELRAVAKRGTCEAL